jgi:broad specificity phosphatase PhoE
MGRLILVRHGRSAHVHDGSWIDPDSARRFEDAYDAASIRSDDAPPPELLALAKTAGAIVASDLPRAIASAQQLAPGREPEVSPLLRELKFNLPEWGPALPLKVWDALHFTAWTGLMMAGADTDETRRAADAAEWVASRCSPDGLTIAVTHGGFRRLLAQALVARGWVKPEFWNSHHNWSAWTLVR